LHRTAAGPDHPCDLAHAGCQRQWRLFRGASVDGGRLELEESWCSRAASTSSRLRRVSTTRRTLRSVCCQSAAGMGSPSGRGVGSSWSLTMQAPLAS
jgi:hypothetical protein